MTYPYRKHGRFNFYNDLNDDNDADENDNLFKTKRSATVYVVDSGEAMFKTIGGDDSYFTQSIKCIRSALRSKIFTMESGLACIILAGTSEKENHLNLNNLFIIHPLEPINADHIKKMDQLIIDVESKSFSNKYGHGDLSPADIFWLVSRIFSEKKGKINKKIVLFTNNDDPVKNNNQDKTRAISSAMDMAQNRILLQLMHMGATFDSTKFYKEIVGLSHNDVDYQLPNPTIKMEEMLQRVGKMNHYHVTMAKIPLIISDNFYCGVAIHSLVRKFKNPPNIKISKATNEQVVSKTQLFEEETGEEIEKRDLVKVISVGNEDIVFKNEECEPVDGVECRAIRLMGFKPASVINLEHYIKPCVFIYPDESKYAGSTVFFSALLKRCLARKVVAICSYYPRPTSTARFIALLPQSEVLAIDKSQVVPPGFMAVFLPFAEEVRDTDEKTCGRKRANSEQVELAMKLVKKLKFKYKPECFNDPKRRNRWAYVEALALDLKEPEQVTDSIAPDYDMMSFRSGELAEQFNAEMFSEGYIPNESKPMKKAVKKDVPAVYTDAVEEKIRNGEGQQLTNATLKSYLQSVGKGQGLSKMNKSDLLDAINEYLADK